MHIDLLDIAQIFASALNSNVCHWLVLYDVKNRLYLRETRFTHHVRYYIPLFKIGTLETSNLTYIILCFHYIQDESRCFSAALLYSKLLIGKFMPYHFNNYVEICTLDFRSYEPI